jgi:hypothetical protein
MSETTSPPRVAAAVGGAEMRFERKFVPENTTRHELAQLLKTHPAGFYEPYPPRNVNNLYLESIDFRGYRESVDGERDRTKIRVRWYGEPFGEVASPTLEFKIKSGLVGRKQRFPLGPFTLCGSFGRAGLRALLEPLDIPAALRPALLASDLQLLNGYRRRYFESRDRRFRITLDYDLWFCRLHPLRNRFLQTAVEHALTIVELKYSREDDAHAHDIAQHFPFRLTKSSKYVNGLDKVCLW